MFLETEPLSNPGRIIPVKRIDDAEISDAQLEEPIQAPVQGPGAYDIDVSAQPP